MAGQRIAVTASRRYQALGIGGTRVIDQWDTLTALLAAELGPEHAALFAEPQRNAAQSEVDWYAPSGSGAVPVSTLPPDQRAAVEAKARALEADIRGLAQRLAQKPDPTSKLLAAVLETALSLPEPREEHLYAAGGQPVLVAWGHVRAESAVTQETLTGRIATPAPPMAILPPPAALPLVAPQRSWLWLAWLAALLALLAALFLLWRDPFGLLNPQPVACQADLSGLAGLEALREESEREAVLRRELARITAEAGARRASCPPPPPPPPEPEPPPPPPPPPPPRRPPPPPPPPPPPQRPPQNDDLQRVEGAGGRSGNLQIILAWDTRSDLDLHVICPNGQRMFYANRRACGGELDVDANAGGPITTRPVENARWERPAPGRYRVEVHNYEGRGLDRVPYRVTIRRPGHPDQVINGVANAGERPHPVTTVDLTE